MTAVASAPPSTGSVPAPNSSSSTSAGSASLRSIDAMLVTCHEKVLRLAAIDCSSPMSAKTLRNTGSREPGAAGMCNPAWAIRASSPVVLSATVLPPVFGPVMISTLAGGVNRMSTGTGSAARPAWARAAIPAAARASAGGETWPSRPSSTSRSGADPPDSRSVTARISSGCRAARSSRPPSLVRPARSRRPAGRIALWPAARPVRSPPPASAAGRAPGGGTRR